MARQSSPIRRRPDVSTHDNLHTSENQFGDICKVIDTGNIYIWLRVQSTGLADDWTIFVKPSEDSSYYDTVLDCLIVEKD
jgi:hypothetical protein